MSYGMETALDDGCLRQKKQRPAKLKKQAEECAVQIMAAPQCHGASAVIQS